jgi:hypothetical protein
MDERTETLDIIESYIKKLENIKSHIDDEIKSRYFRLSCMGGDIEYATVYLNKKYHKKEWDDDTKEY